VKRRDEVEILVIDGVLKMSESDNSATESDAVAMFEAALDRSFGGEPAAKEVKEGEDPELVFEPEEEEKETEEPEAKKFTVKVDGKDVDVSEDELKNGYSRQQDYTKKTMELSAQRSQFEAQANQIQNERQQYQAQLNQLTQALGQQLGNQPDWDTLLENDPVEYLKQQHLYNQRQAAYQQATQEQARTQQQTEYAQSQHMQQVLINEKEQLLANLKSWSDPAKAEAEQTAISKDLIERGYTAEQVKQITDHKLVILAREAMLYRQMVAKAKETTKKVEALPPRMQKPGVAVRAPDGRTADFQALKKSGSIADATKLFENLF
jgi:hypothetical protein